VVGFSATARIALFHEVSGGWIDGVNLIRSIVGPLCPARARVV